MREYYPKEWLPHNDEEEKHWSPNSIVKAQTGKFHYFFFDTQTSIEDWIAASQQHQAWSIKTLTEIFRRDNRMNTFAIHLFIDAFPSGWMKTIMDFKRNPKRAFFEYRNALEPMLPSIRTDRFKFYSGEEMLFEAWISNDLAEIPQKTTLHYQLESGNEILHSQKAKSDIESCMSTFQGYIKLQAPRVQKRTEMILRIALLDEQGHVINDNFLPIEVFPEPETVPALIYTVGKRGIAEQLAEDVQARLCPLNDAKVILIDDFEDYKKNADRIDRSVHQGARAIFLELNENGTYEISDSKVDVKLSRFNPLHFVSRNTGHRWVEGFKWDDFRLWYDPKKDRIKAIIEATFTCDDFMPILYSGNADDNANWDRALAAGEKQYGNGSFMICQVQLAGRIRHNPIAGLFASRLLSFNGR